MLKTILASIALIAVVLGVGAAIAFKKYKMMTAPPPPNVEQPEIVIFATPQPVLIRQTSTTVGTILAPRSVNLKTEVAGTISDISFQAGDLVRENQVLLKLDTSVEEAQLASAEAVLQIAEFTYKRTKQAADAKAISELELEQVAAGAAQAQSEVNRFKAVIRKKTLRAPFDARAGLFDMQPGQYLPEGTQVTMLQGIADYLHIDFMMPQQVADEVHVGDNVRIVMEPAPLTANIIAMDSQSDRITRNLMARAKLTNPPATLQPNDSVRLEIEFGKETQAMTIPASGLRRSPTGAFVYVVTPDATEPSKERVHIQPVVPGKTLGQQIAIMSGLSANQVIVADGSFKLREGLWVKNVETPSVNVSTNAPVTAEPTKAATSPNETGGSAP